MALILVSAFATISLRTFLTSETDKTLSSSGQIVASQTVDALIQGSSSTLLPSEFYLFIRDDFGTAVEEVHHAVEQQFGKPLNAAELANGYISQPRSVPGTRLHTQWRVISVPLTSTGPNPRTVGHVLIGLPLEQVERTVANLRQVLTLFVLVITSIGSLVSIVLIRRSLRGLRTVNHVSSDVRRGNFSARVPPMKPGSEVNALGESINAMLDEIQTLFDARAASEQRMRRFVSDASHELRTPLATIRGYAELYRLGGVPSDQIPQAFGRIESESGRMANLVEDLLKLARLDERGEINPKPVDLAAVALNTVSDFLARAPQRSATVTNLDGGEVESVVIMGDNDSVTQLLTNLLGNVSTHTESDVAVEVAVGINPENSAQAIVEVRDHGQGIPEKDRDHIFERFYKIDSSRSRCSGEGSGLGLAIVAAIAAAHHGRVSIKETPGGGLTVRLSFPLPYLQNHTIDSASLTSDLGSPSSDRA
ncbi:sensor histidine kinase [Arcanobacterium pinnipediorum]|uniref:histidine kinase n=1 Tax=Arcanobacterium pinnipediorum TaxID=1503041 RepID=A0ABY5AGB7_9ACTO|nr:HAMP domain-containing sensor histidine kinase [Arcanobacterium pinnipediorum]USR79254.1 HAMP domain-containing histidine kinase [Arcanobacterium pinnipediorum]